MEIQNDNKKGGPKLSAQVEICDREPPKKKSRRAIIDLPFQERDFNRKFCHNNSNWVNWRRRSPFVREQVFFFLFFSVVVVARSSFERERCFVSHLHSNGDSLFSVSAPKLEGKRRKQSTTWRARACTQSTFCQTKVNVMLAVSFFLLLLWHSSRRLLFDISTFETGNAINGGANITTMSAGGGGLLLSRTPTFPFLQRDFAIIISSV